MITFWGEISEGNTLTKMWDINSDSVAHYDKKEKFYIFAPINLTR